VPYGVVMVFAALLTLALPIIRQQLR